MNMVTGTMSGMRRAMAVATVALALVAGCSSDSDEPEGGSAETPRPVASEAILDADDLGEGWGPAESSFELIEQVLMRRAESVESCESVRINTANTGAERKTASFDGDGSSVSVAVTEFDDEAEAADQFEELTSEDSVTCMEDLLAAVTGGELAAQGPEPVEGLGDEATRLTLTGDAGQTIELTWVQAGANLVSWSVNSPEPIDVDAALNALVERLS